MGNPKTLAGSVNKLPLHRIGRSKPDAVNKSMQLPIFRLELRKKPVNIAITRYIAAVGLRTRQRQNQVPSLKLQAFVLISDDQLCAGGMQSLGDAPGNAAFVGYAKNEGRASFHTERHARGLHKMGWQLKGTDNSNEFRRKQETQFRPHPLCVKRFRMADRKTESSLMFCKLFSHCHLERSIRAPHRGNAQSKSLPCIHAETPLSQAFSPSQLESPRDSAGDHQVSTLHLSHWPGREQKPKHESRPDNGKSIH